MRYNPQLPYNEANYTNYGVNQWQGVLGKCLNRFKVLENRKIGIKILILTAIGKQLAEPYRPLTAILGFGPQDPLGPTFDCGNMFYFQEYTSNKLFMEKKFGVGGGELTPFVAPVIW